MVFIENIYHKVKLKYICCTNVKIVAVADTNDVVIFLFSAVIVIAVGAVANTVVATAVVFVAVVDVVVAIVDVDLYATMLVDSLVFSISLINFLTTLHAYVVKLIFN